MSITVANLQYNRAVFRIFITLLKFSFDSPSYVVHRSFLLFCKFEQGKYQYEIVPVWNTETKARFECQVCHTRFWLLNDISFRLSTSFMITIFTYCPLQCNFFLMLYTAPNEPSRPRSIPETHFVRVLRSKSAALSASANYDGSFL